MANDSTTGDASNAGAGSGGAAVEGDDNAAAIDNTDPPVQEPTDDDVTPSADPSPAVVNSSDTGRIDVAPGVEPPWEGLTPLYSETHGLVLDVMQVNGSTAQLSAKAKVDVRHFRRLFGAFSQNVCHTLIRYCAVVLLIQIVKLPILAFLNISLPFLPPRCCLLSFQHSELILFAGLQDLQSFHFSHRADV